MIALPARAVIKREFLTGMRDYRPYLFLATLMVVMILGLLLLLEVVYGKKLERGGSIDAGFVALLFTDFSRCLYLSAILLVPPMAAVSICVERQQDSYDLLQMTYIRPLSLAVAKLANVLGIYLLIVIATLPFVGVTFFLIGIDWTQFMLTLTLIVFSAFSLSVIGLLCSARFYRTLPAIVFTYVLGYGVHGGLLIGLMLTTELVAPNSFINYRLNRLPEPLYTALLPFYGIDEIRRGGLGLETLGCIVAYHGAIIGLGLYLVMRTLRNPTPTGRPTAPPPIDHQETLATRRTRFPYYLLDPRRRRALIADRTNPIIARELQVNVLAQGPAAVRLFYGYAIFSFLVSLVCMDLYGKHNEISTMAGWTYLYVTIFIVLLAPSLVATSVAREWEWENVDSLRSTLLTSHDIFRGKFLAAMRTLAIPVAGALLGSFPLFIFGRDGLEVWYTSALGAIMMAICVLYALAISLWATVACRRTISALLVAYGSCGVSLLLIPPAALIITRATIARFYPGTDDVAFYNFLSPLSASYALVNNSFRFTWEYSLLYGALNCAFFLVVTVALLYWTRRRFVRIITGEQS